MSANNKKSMKSDSTAADNDRSRGGQQVPTQRSADQHGANAQRPKHGERDAGRSTADVPAGGSSRSNEPTDRSGDRNKQGNQSKKAGDADGDRSAGTATRDQDAAKSGRPATVGNRGETRD